MKNSKVQIEKQASRLVAIVASFMVATILLTVILTVKFGVINLM